MWEEKKATEQDLLAKIVSNIAYDFSELWKHYN